MEIKIGNQIWMSHNLNVYSFRNGDVINQASSIEEWEWADINKEPAFCYYDNLESNENYGKLYNWHAVSDMRGLAPIGFHIPTAEEWLTLEDFLGGYKIAGKFLKSLQDHNNKEEKTMDEKMLTKFNGLLSGARLWESKFLGKEKYGLWWSSTEFNTYYSFHRILSSGSNLFGEVCNGGKGFGMSVRCLKDKNY